MADDLLKNDGQKFLEMMEQLADRRMQREGDAAAELDRMSEEDADEDDGVELDDDEEEEEVSNGHWNLGKSLRTTRADQTSFPSVRTS